ncbi:membrane protein [Salmonella enterica subsp. enterica]|nr:membrane protein [Salmonella enterica subsp. enterica]
MLELLKSLVFAVIMVPVVMAIILGLIYGLGEVFNIFFRYRSERPVQTEPLISPNARSVGRFLLLKILLFLPIFSVFNR